MSISALANAFNRVYIKIWELLGYACSEFRTDEKAAVYENMLIISAFICKFFAGVAHPHYVLKRD